MEPSDELLLSRYKQGDARAFRELMERYAPSIYNLAYRFLLDPMEAENVTQETFLRVMLSLGRLRLDLPFKPYLFRIAVNLCRDLARKKRTLTFTDLDSSDDASDSHFAYDAPEVWERLTDAELAARVNTALADLPPPYQIVLLLRYSEDLSYEEIAHTLDLPLNTVRTHLRRAKQRLRARLERDLADNERPSG